MADGPENGGERGMLAKRIAHGQLQFEELAGAVHAAGTSVDQPCDLR